jgi:hypothetical protein
MAAYESAPDTLVPVNSNEYSSNTFVGKFDITGMPTLLIISVSDFFFSHQFPYRANWLVLSEMPCCNSVRVPMP